MKEKAKEIRVKISKLIQIVRILRDVVPAANRSVQDYLLATELKLVCAFTWMGEFLKVFNEENPYPSGNDKTTTKVEGIQDWFEGIFEPMEGSEVQIVKLTRDEIKEIDRLVAINILRDSVAGSHECRTVTECRTSLIEAKNLLGFTLPLLGEVQK